MNSAAKKIRVGVLRGGPSDEYEQSLNTGKHIIDSLQAPLTQDKYEVSDIFIDRSGNWHLKGLVRPVERVLPHVDIVVNGLHGAYGEDGRVQHLLELHRMPFTGTGSLGSAISMNISLAKKFFRDEGLLVTEHLVVKKENFLQSLLHRIKTRYPHLRLVRPATQMSLGMTVISHHDELESAIQRAFAFSDTVLLEEHVNGRHIMCGVVEGNDGVYALRPVGEFSAKEMEQLQDAAVRAHNVLGLRHYSSADFVMTKFGPYIIGVRTLPNLGATSPFSKALETAGIQSPEFLDHIITLGL